MHRGRPHRPGQPVHGPADPAGAAEGPRRAALWDRLRPDQCGLHRPGVRDGVLGRGHLPAPVRHRRGGAGQGRRPAALPARRALPGPDGDRPGRGPAVRPRHAPVLAARPARPGRPRPGRAARRRAGHQRGRARPDSAAAAAGAARRPPPHRRPRWQPAAAAPGPARPEGETGRGLRLVETLASAWGVYRRPDHSKVIWCTLRLWRHPAAGPASGPQPGRQDRSLRRRPAGGPAAPRRRSRPWAR